MPPTEPKETTVPDLQPQPSCATSGLLSPSAPQFLGAAQRAQHRGPFYDVVGGGFELPMFLFPCNLSSIALIFSVPTDLLPDRKQWKLTARNDHKPEMAAWYSMIATRAPNEQNVVADHSDTTAENLLTMKIYDRPPLGPTHQLLALPCPNLTLTQPSIVRVEVEINEQMYVVGRFGCPFQPPAPLSESERRALRSQPGALRCLQLKFCCNSCKDEINLWTALDPNEELPSFGPDAIEVQSAPNTWQCSCGDTLLPTEYAKNGLHELFRQVGRRGAFQPLATSRLYESGAISRILSEYQQLITANPKEEQVQSFIEKHPILWSFLAPVQILHKPSVLTRYKADFAVLTSNKILYLIEIEKPQTRLFRRDLGQHADLQRGVDQLNNWRVVTSDHRHAVIKELGFKDDEVHDFRFMLIAGLTQRTKADGLSKLRRYPPNGIEFLCFDELAAYLYRVDRELSAI